METSGQFVIIEGGAVCASGVVKFLNSLICSSTTVFEQQVDRTINFEDNSCIKLSRSEIYKELRVRGFEYGPSFQGLSEARADGRRARNRWKGFNAQ